MHTLDVHVRKKRDRSGISLKVYYFQGLAFRSFGSGAFIDESLIQKLLST